jgi:succinoglycan biosynthesis transport protein ExoP
MLRVGALNGFQTSGAAPDLRWYLSVLWRRKFVVLPLLVLLPLTTHLLAKPAPPSYEASATVLLNRQSQGVSEIGDPTLWDPQRMIRTQSQLARLPEVATRVAQAAGLPGRDAGSILASSSISADPENDFLIFRVRDAEPSVAVRLANLYATKYIEYRSELDTKALGEALRQVTEQIEQLRSQGVKPDTQAYQSLIGRQQQLQTTKTLQTSKALLVRPAAGAGLIASQTRRTVMLALGLGLILGLGLAFIVETLDTRVRAEDELVGRLGLPLLGAIPPPARHLRRQGQLAMLDEPNSPAAEPYRMLRASLEMARPTDCRLLMVTSAVEAEGKSTTAANLAVAMARAGQHVILVDLDLYRPGLERWFRLPPTPGLTDVAIAKVPLEQAVRQVSLRSEPRLAALMNQGSAFPAQNGHARPSQNGHGRAGRLELLTRGSAPENPGEFIATQEFEVALERLLHRADVVIVDGPPLLLSGDGMMLGSKLDGMLVVARLNVLKQAQVQELERVLSSCPATKLGLVVTGAPSKGGGYYYYRYHGREIGEPQRQLAD